MAQHFLYVDTLTNNQEALSQVESVLKKTQLIEISNRFYLIKTDSDREDALNKINTLRNDGVSLRYVVAPFDAGKIQGIVAKEIAQKINSYKKLVADVAPLPSPYGGYGTYAPGTSAAPSTSATSFPSPPPYGGYGTYTPGMAPQPTVPMPPTTSQPPLPGGSMQPSAPTFNTPPGTSNPTR